MAMGSTLSQERRVLPPDLFPADTDPGRSELLQTDPLLGGHNRSRGQISAVSHLNRDSKKSSEQKRKHPDSDKSGCKGRQLWILI